MIANWISWLQDSIEEGLESRSVLDCRLFSLFYLVILCSILHICCCCVFYLECLSLECSVFCFHFHVVLLYVTDFWIVYVWCTYNVFADSGKRATEQPSWLIQILTNIKRYFFQNHSTESIMNVDLRKILPLSLFLFILAFIVSNDIHAEIIKLDKRRLLSPLESLTNVILSKILRTIFYFPLSGATVKTYTCFAAYGLADVMLGVVRRFPEWFNDDTVMELYAAGEYKGLDGITGERIISQAFHLE